MKTMNRDMTKMVNKMDLGEEAINNIVGQLQSKFPANQPEISARQILGIIENVHNIVKSVKPGSIRNIVDLAGSVSPQEIENTKHHVMNIIARVDMIVSSIPVDNIDKIVAALSLIDTTKINSLMETISKLHEIKIQI